jgi:DNA polymerase-3 subunit alpha
MAKKAAGKFVSLHNHTELGSPLDGMNDVHDLFVRAKEVDHPAVAVTDHGTMTAIYDAWKASKETGVKLIPGMEAYFADDLTKKKNNHLVLLAQNEVGYKNLLRLNYEAYKNQVSGYMGKYTPRISWEHISDFNEGIIALTACSSGLVAKTLITEEDEAQAIAYMRKFQSIFKDRFYLELQPHNLLAVNEKTGKEVNQKKLNEALIRLSSDLDIPYVITCDAHYRDKDHAKYHDFMLAIKDKKAVDDPHRFRYGVQDMYLKTHEEITDFFGNDVAEVGMANTMKISNLCEVPHYIEPKGPILPKFPIKSEDDYDEFKTWHLKSASDVPEDQSYLRYKCIEGFKKKLKGISSNDKALYWKRVKTELKVLEAKDFSSYMLIVADYINWAKDSGMPVGPARGSAAGSLVAFLTGITTIDPIKYDLIFERFHNNEKESFPDIDTDFSNPGLVKDYLKTKYGEDRIASISNWSRLSPKVIIKDVARSLQLGGDKSTAFKIANHITDIMPDEKTIELAMSESKEFRAYMKKYPKLYENASKLQGLTRNWSVHAAGIVIADRPLYEVAPLRIDPKTGLVVVQWEKTRCEENGLIKHDLLGVKTLTVIDEAFNLIEVTTGKNLSIEDIPLDDDETYDMIGRGETSGVFQLESSLTPLCMRIKPRDVEGISNINALGRPSCSRTQRQDYIMRLMGQETTTYRHANLENALKKTYGVSLYEEGMMTIAKDCAGWDLNQADALRKITKLKGKNPQLVLKTETNFIKDCMSHSDMTYKNATEVWRNEIEPFGEYGFNKSHSISYSHISYYTAWLRCHYPTEFMCALLNSEKPNSNEIQEYIHSCGKMGIEITPPKINSSGSNYVVVGGEIATGLSAVKGVGDKAIMAILEMQPFTDFKDFLVRTPGRIVNKRVIQALAKAGAFDEISVARMDAYENYAKYRTKINAHIKKEKSIDLLSLPAYHNVWDRKETLVNEKEVLGRTISGSLHEVFPGFFRKDHYSVTPLSKLDNRDVDSRVKIEVIVNSKIKEFTIKKGKNKGKKFAKYLVEDVFGNTTELTVWADQYNRYRDSFIDGIPIKAICKVGEYMEQRSLSLVALEAIFGKKI